MPLEWFSSLSVSVLDVDSVTEVVTVTASTRVVSVAPKWSSGTHTTHTCFLKGSPAHALPQISIPDSRNYHLGLVSWGSGNLLWLSSG